MGVDRIRTTHAGSLPRPEPLYSLVTAKARGEQFDQAALAKHLAAGVREVVRRQAETGLDGINDGELSKINFTTYARERLAGHEDRPAGPDAALARIYGRDAQEFEEFFAGRGNLAGREVVCVGPLTYAGHDSVRVDVQNFAAALDGIDGKDAFLPAVAPGTIEHWMKNEHYATDEEFLGAIADAMREEYNAIHKAGFQLQIDDPDLADAWQIHTDMDVAEYRKFAELRLDALNYALQDIPEEDIRFHMCWGSYHGPHKYDIPLADIVDLVLKVKAHAYSIEASNPCHEHEWNVWEHVQLPDDKILIPGVVGHATDFIEHPELIAQRLVRYADLVGRERVWGGTDCGLGTRVGHPQIAWAKFEALAAGARLATERLWG